MVDVGVLSWLRLEVYRWMLDAGGRSVEHVEAGCR